MPVGGLTHGQKLRTAPDEVKRVIMALAANETGVSEERGRSDRFFCRLANMDRQTASKSYELAEKSFSANGVPTRTGMENIREVDTDSRPVCGRNIASTKSPTQALQRRWRESWDIG